MPQIITTGEWLKAATISLKNAKIPSARLDSLIILEDALAQDRAHLLAHEDTLLRPADLTSLNKKIVQRSSGKPLAYIRGQVEFYGRNFGVGPGVLIPRPETEDLINLLKICQDQIPHNANLVDIGCGSGCVGITAALELPSCHVTLADISKTALAVATANANKLAPSKDIHYVQSNLMSNCNTRRYDAILANLPYVPTSHTLDKGTKFEPKRAIFSGQDGLNHYRRLWLQLAQLNYKPAFVITESLLEQHKKLNRMASRTGYQLEQSKGLAQMFKKR